LKISSTYQLTPTIVAFASNTFNSLAQQLDEREEKSLLTF
jgi:hypothetical protein